MTGRKKALAVFTAAVVLTLLSAGLWGSPLTVDPVVQDTGQGVVGVIGLTVARAFTALGAALAPLLVLLRVLAVPLALAGLAYLAVRTLRRA